MKQEIIIANHAIIEALDFIASRLLIFKRVQREALSELTAKKFNMEIAEELVEVLIQQGAVELRHEALVVLNERTLKSFCLGTVNLAGKLKTRFAA